MAKAGYWDRFNRSMQSWRQSLDGLRVEFVMSICISFHCIVCLFCCFVLFQFNTLQAFCIYSVSVWYDMIAFGCFG